MNSCLEATELSTQIMQQGDLSGCTRQRYIALGKPSIGHLSEGADAAALSFPGGLCLVGGRDDLLWRDRRVVRLRALCDIGPLQGVPGPHLAPVRPGTGREVGMTTSPFLHANVSCHAAAE